MEARVLITGPAIAEEALALLKAAGVAPVFVPPYAKPQELEDVAGRERIDAMIVRMGQIDASVIGASPRLAVIAKHGVGVNNIDVEAATGHGIPVLTTRGANSQSVAEHALALMLALVKDILPLDRALREGRWDKATYKGAEMAGKHLGLVGYGDIGRRLAAMVRPFAMEVTVYDPHIEAGDLDHGARLTGDLDGLLASADIVSLHCPLTDQTRDLIGADRLALMKSTAYLVNTARGGIVNEDALVRALRDGTIAGAGLDGFAEEPPPEDSVLWSLPNVVVTPHIAGATAAALRRMGVHAAENVLGVLGGGHIDHRCIVNPSVLPEMV